jgi:hypothetical protein
MPLMIREKRQIIIIIMMIIVNRSLVLCADVYSTLNKHWNDTNRMIIMNLIARQDIIGKLGTVILFLKSSI